MRRIQGRAKRMGEYQRNPKTMVDKAATKTARKLIPIKEPDPIMVIPPEYGDAGNGNAAAQFGEE
jgi:hypothetical protein